MITIDRSASTALAVCSCGWRSLASNDVRAWRAGAEHERNCHPGHTEASSNLVAATRRAFSKRQ